MAMVFTDIRSLASKSAKVSLLKFPLSSAGLCFEMQNNMVDWTKEQVQLSEQSPLLGILPGREALYLMIKEEEVEVPSICPAVQVARYTPGRRLLPAPLPLWPSGGTVSLRGWLGRPCRSTVVVGSSSKRFGSPSRETK